jgi:hypothetical protein
VGFPPDTSTLTVSDSSLTDNVALGGAGGSGGNGGDGLGGGLYTFTATSAAVSDSVITRNQAHGGAGGAGGNDGHGVGGGVYHLGTFTVDAVTLIRHNHASTSNDDIFP